ncbi:MAG: hypothetical protein A2751_01420 [Candidatus Doudnabacteria bacterium RIFCSPHIGHO2_01_FULL_46_14]|uniref:Uncharacterized protein n=1 Tax=Candidatus Doudnabacteria bacterium RIFCSPHIGHO2_01_FULL_46_14 TaxID=1817824 RepID=A0A1F5NMF0_9BACT|nr:MAG: hypothetical protein A2751_01420 [Candidatus Doudnabacteria bacterium RIFCSPHIGHO2_01_FULL_46_14]
MKLIEVIKLILDGEKPQSSLLNKALTVRVKYAKGGTGCYSTTITGTRLGKKNGKSGLLIFTALPDRFLGFNDG